MRETSFTNSECKSKCIWLSGTVTPIRFHGDFYGCLDDLDIQLGGNNTLDSFFTDSLTDCRNMNNQTNFASTTQINKEYSFVCCKFNLCNDEYHKQLIDTHPPTTSTSGKEFNRAGNVDISNADSPTWIPVSEEKKTPIYVTFNELPTNEVNVTGDYIKKLDPQGLSQYLELVSKIETCAELASEYLLADSQYLKENKKGPEFYAFRTKVLTALEKLDPKGHCTLPGAEIYLNQTKTF
uniref:MANSC domain-containing protein n=1 Tax=Rhabditophanes sp. KR3021 TaxID=114890 RepID=A0AC35TUQ6_9BILA